MSQLTFIIDEVDRDQEARSKKKYEDQKRESWRICWGCDDSRVKEDGF